MVLFLLLISFVVLSVVANNSDILIFSIGCRLAADVVVRVRMNE